MLCKKQEKIMINECKEIKSEYEKLIAQPATSFPKFREKLDVPKKQGVYIIYQNGVILHVGRTTSANNGLYQRLKDHLYGTSSFVHKYLDGNGAVLREGGYTFQYMIVDNSRKRALIEAYATGSLCPKHLGLGKG